MDPPSRDAVMLAINHLMELVKCFFLCRIDLLGAVVLCVLPGRSDCTALALQPLTLHAEPAWTLPAQRALPIIHGAYGLCRVVLRDCLHDSKQTRDPALKFPAGVDLTPSSPAASSPSCSRWVCEELETKEANGRSTLYVTVPLGAGEGEIHDTLVLLTACSGVICTNEL